MAKKTHYAVKNGRQSGVIVTTWEECKALVDWLSGAKFKGFSSMCGAKEWIGSGKIDKSKPAKRSFNRAKHYCKDGIRYADYGVTIGSNYKAFTGDLSIPPWDDGF